MSEPAIGAHGLRKSYQSGGRPLVVLDGLELTVAAGELVAIVGASGVGKSTLLHVIGGLDPPDAGRVEIYGRDLAALAPEERARMRNREIGFVFQFHYLLPEFDALENVMMPLLLRREAAEVARDRARRMLVEMGLEARATHRPGELSGGEQQRVAVARALVGEPRVVLLDEPTGNLDRASGERVFDGLLERVRARRLSTVLVTHNEQLAGRADRVLRVDAGRLQAVKG